MKKLLLSVLLCASAIIANAQIARTIDLEVLSITKPDTARDGQTIPFTFTFRNNGPDSIHPGDSLFYQLGVDSNKYVSSFQLVFFSSNIGPAVTFPISIGFPGIPITNIHNANACVLGILQNRGNDSVRAEFLTFTNNTLCEEVHFTYIYPVSVDENFGVSSFNMFPNPAGNVVNFDYSLRATSDVNVRITDVTGKEVTSQTKSQQTAGHYSLNFDISTLAPGMYITHIQVGATVKTEKLIISR